MKASQQKRIASQTNNSTGNATGKSAADTLRDAINQVISRDSVKIAEALATNGKKGMVQSIKLMRDLSEGGSKSEEHDDAARIRSMATELENAPPWAGPLPSEHRNETSEGAGS